MELIVVVILGVVVIVAVFAIRRFTDPARLHRERLARLRQMVAGEEKDEKS